MVGSDGSDNPPGNPSFTTRLKNCQGCQQRKEYLTNMLTYTRFWFGVLLGVGGTWAYHKYVKSS